MAKTMEDEIDGLDLTASFTGNQEQDGTETRDESPKGEPDPKEPEKKEEPGKGEPGPKGDEGKDKPAEERPDGDGDGDSNPQEPPKDGKFGVKNHTPSGVQKRINELSRSNREIKEQNARLMAELESLKKALPKEPEKTRQDFANDEEWINHLAKKQAQALFEQQRAKDLEEREIADARQSFERSEEEARRSLPDYDDVMSMQVNLPVDRDTYMYVMKSPMGAMVQYTLKKVEAVRNQFLMTPQEGRKAFVQSIEARLNQIRSEAENKKGAAPSNNPQTATPGEPPRQEPTAPVLKQPQDVRHPVSRVPNPATCSMDEWMEYGD